MKLWLFDVDGVLVRAGGYHAALKATVDHFARQMGLPGAGLDDAAIQIFEACGLTSEWDSSAMCLAVMLADAWRDHPHPPASLDQALALAPRPRGDRFPPLARRMARERLPGERPPATALRLLLDGGARLNGVLTELLAHARDFSRSPTMQVFQNYTLGSEAFARTYGRAALFPAPCLLESHDHPLLSAAARQRVLALRAQGRLRAAVYTARPSLPPREGDGAHAPSLAAGYSPEAEIALERVGLQALPLIGYGHVCWLSAREGAHPDAFVKPSPVQALAAIAAAAGAGQAQSVLAAHALFARGELAPPLSALRGRSLEITVFEDSVGGIRGVREAATLLAGAGVSARVVARGIADGPEKKAALLADGVQVWDDINAAITSCL